MPAPLGRTPTSKMPKIDVLGTEDSAATRGAIRFFRERRIVARFVDLRKRPLAVAELREWLAGVGADGLLESAAAPAGDGRDASPNVGELAARLHADPGLLRLPLVRYGTRMTAGKAEATWKAWLAAPVPR